MIKRYLGKRQVRTTQLKHKRYCFLQACPQKLVTCRKLIIAAPKKPNSANRKVSKVQMNKSKQFLFVYIPGQGPHELSPYSQGLIRGGRVRDLPGIRYKLIRGVKDFKPDATRKTSRSKYGTKGPEKKKIKTN
jgi:small subunit ribosomal protein S12